MPATSDRRRATLSLGSLPLARPGGTQRKHTGSVTEVTYPALPNLSFLKPAAVSTVLWSKAS